MTDDLSKKLCTNPKCTGIMKELINMVDIPWTRTCWYCESCGAHDPAIGREKVVHSYYRVEGKA